MAPLAGRVAGAPLLCAFVFLYVLGKDGDGVSWLTRLGADGQLREKHMRMTKTGERPSFLEEYYSSHRVLQRESKRLAELGYRVRSRQHMRDANGYRVTFVYAGAPGRNEPVPLGAGRTGRS